MAGPSSPRPARRTPTVAQLVDEYLAAVADAVYLPLPAAACRGALGAIFDEIVAALIARDFSPAVGRDLGGVLVALQITAPEAATAAARTVASLPDELPMAVTVSRDELRRRTAAILAEFAGGFAEELTRRLIDGQSVVQRAAESARRAAQERERQAQARMRSMFEHARSPVFVADERGRIMEASAGMAAMMEANKELLGPDGDDLRPLLADDPRDAERVLAELVEADDDSAVRIIEHHRTRHGGGIAVGRWVLSSVRSHDDRPALIVGVEHDVTELREMHAQLSHLAHHDPLTGVPNRRCLTVDLARSTGAAPVGFCLIDLDGFKAVNDRIGHAGGDELLVAATRRMQSALSGKGVLYRIGGDEFAVLVQPPFQPRDAAEVVHRALSRPLEVRATGPEGDTISQQVRIGASIGVTVSGPTRNTVETLIAAADSGLYRSKEARRP